MHYFHKLSSAFGALPPPQILTGAPSLDPAEDFRLQTPNLPTHEKNPVDAYAVTYTLLGATGRKSSRRSC